MENINVLIVEDEVLIAEDLKDALLSFGIKQIEMAHNKSDALIKLTSFDPDLILLDIRMEGNTDGLDIANEIRKDYKVPYIFVTSHSDVELIKEIVKTNPAGYITKPFKKSDLFANVTLALSAIEKSSQTLKIKEGYETHLIKISEINYIRSEGNYIDIFYADNKRITCRRSLESLLLELNLDVFYKINKSHIINLNKVKSYNTKEVMLNDISITISRNYIDDFENKLNSISKLK